jgi:hypothetical protein
MRRVGIEAEESIMTAKRTDNGICVNAMREARRILNEYVEPGSADAVATLEQLLEVLDDRAVQDAMARTDCRRHFGVVTVDYYGPPEGAPEA